MKTLYIIHGWTYTTKPWTHTIELLEKSGAIKVKMLHVPGLTSPSNAIWNIDQYVAWANENLPDHATVLGHSNGGRILLNLLSHSPQKLRHVILLNSAGIYESSKKRDLLRRTSKLLSPLKKLPLLRKIIHKILGANDYERAPENMKQTLANMLDSDQSLDLSSISTKISILWGESDQTTPLRQGKALHKALKNSTFKSYKNWTHAPYISHPKALAQAILHALEDEK